MDTGRTDCPCVGTRLLLGAQSRLALPSPVKSVLFPASPRRKQRGSLSAPSDSAGGCRRAWPQVRMCEPR